MLIASRIKLFFSGMFKMFRTQSKNQMRPIQGSDSAQLLLLHLTSLYISVKKTIAAEFEWRFAMIEYDLYFKPSTIKNPTMTKPIYSIKLFNI